MRNFRRHCRWLIDQGHEAIHVTEAMPGETPDGDIAAYASEHRLILVTKDEDFLTRHPPGTYALVWLRLGNVSNRSLVEWLEMRLAATISALELGEMLVEVR